MKRNLFCLEDAAKKIRYLFAGDDVEGFSTTLPSALFIFFLGSSQEDNSPVRWGISAVVCSVREHRVAGQCLRFLIQRGKALNLIEEENRPLLALNQPTASHSANGAAPGTDGQEDLVQTQPLLLTPSDHPGK